MFWEESNVATTCWLLFIVSSQVELLPLQPPPALPPKDEFVPAVSVRVTCDPEVKLALHVGPQLMPAGLLLIVPPPAPAAWMLS